MNPALALIPLGAAGFFLLAGYELSRSVSSSLFIEAYGAANLPWAMTGSFAVIGLLVYGYGRLLSVLKPWKTFLATKAFFFAVFLLFWAALKAGSRPAAAGFYFFREAYIMLIVEQCWSFVNSRLSLEQGRRYNGLFLGVTGIGAYFGAKTVSWWVTSLGSHTMILLSAATLIPSAILAALAFRIAGEPPATGQNPGDPMGLRKLFSSRLLLIMAGLVFVTQAGGTLLDQRWNLLAQEAFPQGVEGMMDLRSKYFAEFWSNVNLYSWGLQFIGTPLILRAVSPRIALILIPFAHLMAVGHLLLSPSLGAGALAFGMFKVVDYSLHRAAKETLYIPLSFDERYRAKEVIDAFGYRASKALTAFGLAALKTLGSALPAQAYAGGVLGALILWLGLVLGLPRQPQKN